MALQRPPWTLLYEKDPERARLHEQLDQLAFSDGRLSKKVKLLMAMAIDATLGAEGGVQVYATRAKEAGATEEELFEAVRVASLIGGTRALTTALRALETVVGRR
ncbi:MAG TPA: carboxymuconolactone decarboxylase family protein [Chloroflexota bacterium]|jgi:alkylhydroperoxidase/carboxymuconolactone decarboxylase family protein YurZ|nr:carboxymuconolactone decarboxylase family protein [Chloroflexota bacterium]